MIRSGGRDAENSANADTVAACRATAARLAGAPADIFLQEVLAYGLGGLKGPWDALAVASKLDDPVHCLRSIYGRYAFSRRGKERKALSELAVAALERALSSRADLATLCLETVWQHYCEGCDLLGKKALPDLNRGVVLGLAGLAQSVYQDRGISLARHVATVASEYGRVEPTFFSIVELRGVGPKVAATMLRDWVFTFGVEDKIVHRDSIYLQPIDRWTRLAAPHVIEEPNAADFPDWILAGKFGKAARNAQVSGIRLNMGVSWLGLEAGTSATAEQTFYKLLSNPEL